MPEKRLARTRANYRWTPSGSDYDAVSLALAVGIVSLIAAASMIALVFLK